MNELSARWQIYPWWSELFDESDRLLVESLVRRAQYGSSQGVLDESDDEFLLCLLLLARATRKDHVALSLLSDVEIDLESNITVRRVEASLLQRVLSHRAHRLSVLVEVIEIDNAVSERGAPVVVATRHGVPQYCYLRRLAHAEWRLSDALVRSQNELVSANLELFLAAAATLADSETAHAARRLAQHRVSVITGGPGTGKTTTVARVLQALNRAAVERTTTLRVALGAPTAKAALRLREALREQFGDIEPSSLSFDARSGSLHRLLGLRPDHVVADGELAHDVIIVDEVSMSELTMLDQLIARCSAHTRVILVGDADQLASVNVGAALRDIVDAADVGVLGDLVTRLTHNWRSGDAISRLAEAVNQGDIKAVRAIAHESGEYVRISASRDDVEQRAYEHATALALAAKNSLSQVALNLLGQFTILAATRHGELSVAWWNAKMAASVSHLDESTGRFVVGTPVVITRNERSESSDTLANGDVGVQLGATERWVAFGDAQEPLLRRSESLGEADVAWAITVHKSQGSEYDEVVVSLPRHDVAILTRELLYTALTRARHRVHILASDATLERILARRSERVSGLSARCAALASTNRSI
jgi:exodeoxyribonuclease V alpha subunit